MTFWCVMLGHRCATAMHAIMVLDDCSALMLLFDECAAAQQCIKFGCLIKPQQPCVQFVLFDESAAAMHAILVLDDRPARM